ncbi:N-acetylglucosamine-6-phosphate deacetylase [candidate division KSB1 bacterium]|nr:N-acetylglucosamine-6-phosphate deacetylase [candidate division KSB1 bacterium]
MYETLIKNCTIIGIDRTDQNCAVLLQDGRVAVIGAADDFEEVSASKVIDAHGMYLGPGFIDLHIHGLLRFLIDNGPDHLGEICRTLPRYGVTSFLPTVRPRPPGEDAEFLHTLATAPCDSGSQILGFHLEGPFLALTGGLPPEAVGKSDITRVRALIDAASPYKVVFSISPELEGITDMIKVMRRADMPVFITHTKADGQQTLDAIEAGASHATHFYDVFYPPEQIERGVRPCGVVEAILASPQVSVDFILDGVHVDPIVVKMALQCKGADKICLATDANIGAGLGPGRYTAFKKEVEVAYWGGPARTTGDHPQAGGLSGSSLTLDRAVRNAVKMLGVSVPQAVRMATHNPASVLGLHDKKGRVAQGYDADLTLLDDELNVLACWVAGRCVYDNFLSGENK